MYNSWIDLPLPFWKKDNHFSSIMFPPNQGLLKTPEVKWFELGYYKIKLLKADSFLIAFCLRILALPSLAHGFPPWLCHKRLSLRPQVLDRPRFTINISYKLELVLSVFLCLSIDSAEGPRDLWLLSIKWLRLPHILLPIPSPQLLVTTVSFVIFPNMLPLCPFDMLCLVYVFPDYSNPFGWESQFPTDFWSLLSLTTFLEGYRPAVTVAFFFSWTQSVFCAKCTSFIPQPCETSTANAISMQLGCTISYQKSTPRCCQQCYLLNPFLLKINTKQSATFILSQTVWTY